MDWDSIKAYHLSPPDGKLPRAPSVQAQYEAHTRAIISKAQSVGSYIREKYMSGGKQWALVQNEFPYEFIDDTTHWLLWFEEPTGTSIDISGILKSCGVNKYVQFENTYANRSVKDLRHIHVFTKDDVQPVSTCRS